jgi:hypothetical protein
VEKVIMHYHAHLTVPAFAQCPRGWKETSIVLEADQPVMDLMYTRHFVLGKRNVETIDQILDLCRRTADQLGAVRIKVEQEDQLTLPITAENYVEVHALISDAAAALPPEWRRSRNAKSVDRGTSRYFYTRRFRSGDHSSVQAAIAHELQHVSNQGQLVELKIEQIIIDTNLTHDSWWA